jgi:hypothetical protein
MLKRAEEEDFGSRRDEDYQKQKRALFFPCKAEPKALLISHFHHVSEQRADSRNCVIYSVAAGEIRRFDHNKSMPIPGRSSV